MRAVKSRSLRAVTVFSKTTFLKWRSLATWRSSREVRFAWPSFVQRIVPLGYGKPEATPRGKVPDLATGMRRLRAIAA